MAKPRAPIASHYYVEINGKPADVYVVLRAFDVKDPNVQHAIKKLLRCGKGDKDMRRDVEESIWTLNRWLDIEDEQEASVEDRA